MARNNEMNWKQEIEYSKEDVIDVNNHKLGFLFYRGYDANQDDPKKTIRLIVTERDIHKQPKPYRYKNFETGKAENLQIVFPDSLKFAEEMGKFLLDSVKNAKSTMKANLDELKAQAKEAGLKVEG